MVLGHQAQIILAGLSNQPTIFTEVFTYDERYDQIPVGDAGMHDIRLAENRSAVTITPDYEYPKEAGLGWRSTSSWSGYPSRDHE